MAIEGMNHFTVLTDDLEATRDFYIGLLGLKEGWRPPFTFPGAWLYCGEQAVLHLIAREALPEPRAGVLDHMAFTARDLVGTVETLEARGIEYDLRRLPDSGLWQLFCHDPNGAKVELDFDAAEAAPT
ncbi:MAG: VOC family protein [Ectothiorhodospiraceae bacterium]|nr:VOC family protein [Chromatiales bacterium]MCP5154468.1 VOC family protein [Ectothiorhodospiraceae bacterium]